MIQNASDRTVTGSVEAMTDEGKTASKPITVVAHDHVEVRVSDLVTAKYAVGRGRDERR